MTIDGNPLKQVRRQIVEKGTQEILRYLRDKFIEGKDDQVEQWAKDQNAGSGSRDVEMSNEEEKKEEVDTQMIVDQQHQAAAAA